MPCLFIRNVPSEIAWFDPEASGRLFKEVAEAAGVSPDEVEVHIESTQYRMLTPEGELHSAAVHVFVEWHAGRNSGQKKKVGDAILRFLQAHGLGAGVDVTFRDSLLGTSFYFAGEMVSG